MWKNHNLSVVLLLMFILCIAGQSIAGWKEHNEERLSHGEPAISWSEFLRTSEFGETVFENWESEFFQMAMYVILTVFLYQKGSSESKKHDGSDPSEAHPEEHRKDSNAPAPVRKGGWQLVLYKNSLSIAFTLLFIFSFVMHASTGAARHNDEVRNHGGGEIVSTFQYLGTPQFWYESLQNWQSEFLAVLAIVVLSIYLRQWGSPQSKPVHASHSETGTG